MCTVGPKFPACVALNTCELELLMSSNEINNVVFTERGKNTCKDVCRQYHTNIRLEGAPEVTLTEAYCDYTGVIAFRDDQEPELSSVCTCAYMLLSEPSYRPGLPSVKSFLSPPIFVKGLICFTDLCSELIELIGVDNFSCKSSVNCLKIMTTNPAFYRTLIHFLKEQKAEYHTYQLKEDKPMRVVIRNLHPSTSTELIKSELELRLFEVRQVTSVLHKIDKHPLPLFFVDFEPTSQSNDIHKLKSLIHTKIKVEEPYKLKTISQCINCQDYGHTKSYCGYPARCVCCGALHSSSACTNPRDATPKCALCSGDHPSNYKGCSVYKELQLRNKPKMSTWASGPTKTHYSNVASSVPEHIRILISIKRRARAQYQRSRLPSHKPKISAGVPQGGILSPLLYNIYAADQPTSPNTAVAEFADDKAIISIHDNPHTASHNLQLHLDLMADWYKKWRIKVNQSKSLHTTFTLRLTPCPMVSLDNIQIPSSQTAKYLGLTIDRRLTWSHHIKTKRLALNARLRILKTLISNNKHTPLNTKLLIYKSLFKPMWTYGLQLWGNAKISNTNKIQTFQNKFLRLITNSPPYISNLTLHTDLKMKSIHEEAVAFYKRFHSKLPSHSNPLISNLATLTIPGNSPRRLKRKWCRDLLTV
ncbi:Pre-C2HC domain,Reverse transcriptase domain [Cinara cedri]|uniref:Pre-C2HC domain,Reverse transcriptase domain n=1 Tax=Cinara cedri TaxID=506608 RepID=A0A5E4MH21_9HEMI|nr:Pre-C2HC domain,Reverse transcriptase domain [Cinara cedri]